MTDYYDKAAKLTIMGLLSRSHATLTTKQHEVFVAGIASAMRIVRDKEREHWRAIIRDTAALCREQGLKEAEKVLQLILDMEPTG